MHSCESGLSERKQFRVDDGEHGLTAAVTMSQRPPDHIQQTLGQQEGRQEPHICTQDSRTWEHLGWRMWRNLVLCCGFGCDSYPYWSSCGPHVGLCTPAPPEATHGQSLSPWPSLQKAEEQSHLPASDRAASRQRSAQLDHICACRQINNIKWTQTC